MELNNVAPSCDLNSPDSKCKLDNLNVIGANSSILKQWCNLDKENLVKNVLNTKNEIEKTNLKYSRENKLNDETYNLDNLFSETMCETLCKDGCNPECRRANCWTRNESDNDAANNLNNVLATSLNDTMNPSMSESMNPSTMNPSMNPSMSESMNPSMSESMNPSTMNPSTMNPSTMNPSTMNPSKNKLNPLDIYFNNSLLNSNDKLDLSMSASLNPSNMNPTTMNPSNMNPTTMNPSNMNPTTMNPTTMNPTTMNPSTMNSSTMNPSHNPKMTWENQFSSSLITTVNTDSANSMSNNLTTTMNPSTMNPSTMNPSTMNPSTMNPQNSIQAMSSDSDLGYAPVVSSNNPSTTIGITSLNPNLSTQPLNVTSQTPSISNLTNLVTTNSVK